MEKLLDKLTDNQKFALVFGLGIFMSGVGFAWIIILMYQWSLVNYAK